MTLLAFDFSRATVTGNQPMPRRRYVIERLNPAGVWRVVCRRSGGMFQEVNFATRELAEQYYPASPTQRIVMLRGLERKIVAGPPS